jgi:hypothetical protein
VSVRNNIIVRLITYYLVVVAILSSVAFAFPVLGDYLAAERARLGTRAALELDRAAEAASALPEVTGPIQLLDPERSVPIVLSLVMALLVVLPVVWIYLWTRPRRRHTQSFAHALLVVPIAITLVVFLVKGSLALAFSLAGVVAAIRFRTTLDEPIDAVYLFVVIGIGLAAGVQLLFVALIASVAFNAVALTVWRTNVGGRPVTLDGWRLVLATPEVKTPDAAGVGRPAPCPGADASADPYNARLRLHVTQVDEAQRCATAVLEERTKRWRMAESARETDGTSVITFELRLKKSADLAAFINALEQGVPHVTKVELTRMTSKKSTDS